MEGTVFYLTAACGAFASALVVACYGWYHSTKAATQQAETVKASQEKRFLQLRHKHLMNLRGTATALRDDAKKRKQATAWYAAHIRYLTNQILIVEGRLAALK